MNEFAEKERLLTQPRRMLISSYFMENGTIITPLLLFYLDLGLACKKIYRSVQYTPMKCLNNFVQSAAIARREGDEKLNSCVLEKTMNLEANSCFGYQIMCWSRHTIKKYFSDEEHVEPSIKIFLDVCVI